MLIALRPLDTSDESKAHSKKVMESLGGEDAYYGKQEQDDGKG